MDSQFYPQRFDLLSENSKLSHLILDAALGLNLHIKNKEDQDKTASINYLSKLFYDLSADSTYIDPVSEVELTRFYWPSENYPENLKGKTIEDFRVQTWLFAKNLETFREASEEELERLIEECCELHSIVLTYSSRSRFGLAA